MFKSESLRLSLQSCCGLHLAGSFALRTVDLSKEECLVEVSYVTAPTIELQLQPVSKA